MKAASRPLILPEPWNWLGICGSSTGGLDRPPRRLSLPPRERRWLIGIGLLYAAVVIPIGIRKGGDFTQELTESERLLRGMSLYVANPGVVLFAALVIDRRRS